MSIISTFFSVWGSGVSEKSFEIFWVHQFFFIDFLSQEAETNAKNMELEIGRLQKNLEQKDQQLQDSAFSTEKVYTFSIVYLSSLLLFTVI